MLLLALIVALASATAITNQNGLLKLDVYTQETEAPKCDAGNFLETIYVIPPKGDNASYTEFYCQGTPSSFHFYLFEVQNSSIVKVSDYGPDDNTCAGSPSDSQMISSGSCFKLVGDNPAVSYKATLLSSTCDSSTCKGDTCCASPSGGSPSCGSAPKQCCCPDFQSLCPAGQGCGCAGTCPGPAGQGEGQCNCLGCFPLSDGGICLN